MIVIIYFGLGIFQVLYRLDFKKQHFSSEAFLKISHIITRYINYQGCIFKLLIIQLTVKQYKIRQIKLLSLIEFA